LAEKLFERWNDPIMADYKMSDATFGGEFSIR
jgi:hypothetical protein